MDAEVKKIITSSWNEWAAEYDSAYPHTIKSSEEEIQWEKALKKFAGDSGKDILDVGTGTGFVALILAKLGHKVKGVDISEGMMNEARRKAKEKCLDIRFEYADAEKLNDLDNTYDIVINRFMLWTMQYPEKAIEEWVRVLKPGGKLIIIDGEWFNNKLSYRLKEFLGNMITMITEFRNPWKHKPYFEGQLKEKLPCTNNKYINNITNILVQSGLIDIRTSNLLDVEKVERKAMSLKERLLNPHHKLVIEGIKK